MKILLATLSADKYRHEGDNSAYAVGVGYISSVLKKEGHEVKMISLTRQSVESSSEEFFSTYESLNPDIVGLSIFSPNRIATFKVIEKLRSLPEPQRPHIIIGGIHTTVMYEQIIKKYPEVVAVIGEGERTIVELVKALELNLKLDAIKGIAYYKDGVIVLTERRELIEDLDSLPFPDHEVFFKMEPSRTIGSILTSRGCPSRCSFCSLKVLSNRRVRKRSVENVVEEIKYLKQKFPRIETILFLDDTLLLDNKRVIELCKLLKEADLGLRFGCEARVMPISREMFVWMKKAGFFGIMFGLETGSEKMLESIHKGINREDVLALMRIIEPFKFKIGFFIICGFPEEDNHTIRESVEFIQSIQTKQYVEILWVSKLYVFPGTEIYESMKSAGRITDEYWMTEETIPYYTVDHSLEQLKKYEDYMMDRISLSNSLMARGFCKHFLKMPIQIIKHFLRNKDSLFIAVDASLKRYIPHYYYLVYRLACR